MHAHGGTAYAVPQCGPSTVLGPCTAMCFHPIILTSDLLARDYQYSHFTGEQTEAQGIR